MTFAKPCSDQGLARAIDFGGHTFWLDPSGALYWPSEALLIVADLHFEKGSFLAHAGSALPRYDTRDTLMRLGDVITLYTPAEVLCLGDSFHDTEAPKRFPAADRIVLHDLTQRVKQWHWLLGNHDPVLPDSLPGSCSNFIVRSGIHFTHEISTDAKVQICGHYHPKFSRRVQGHKVSGRALMHDAGRMVLPAFGSYTGGLSCDDPVFFDLFDSPTIYAIMRGKVWKVASVKS